MNAGALRHRCWIKEPTHTDALGDGDTVATWGTVTVCWGALEPLKGREWIESGMENSEITAKFRMRYYASIDPTMQLYFGSRTFEIISVIDPDERRKELELMVKELVHT